MIEAQSVVEEEHTFYMQKALDEALSENCMKPVTLATGYSRELAGNTHAEANALSKAFGLSDSHLTVLFSSIPPPIPSIEDVMPYTDVYTTLEPCSVRKSGLPACADALIKARIKRCVIGVGEPNDFVKCEGAQKLKDVGIDVVWLEGLEKQCLDAARRGHHSGG